MNKIELLKQSVEEQLNAPIDMHPEWAELRKQIETFFIERDTVLPAQRHLMEINGIRCFPRGDIVGISGKEKCGKTTACRILATALLKGEHFGIRALEPDSRILWIDTEQARTSTRSLARAIDLMCGFEPGTERIRFLNLREWPEKGTMLEGLHVVFDTFSPDFVVLDGIRDLIHDFNDVCESANVVLECMRLSSGVCEEQGREAGLHPRLPCSIVCILHQNKPKDDNNMRGHLGTELANKAGEVWESTRDDDDVFAFTQLRSRTRPLKEPITFKVNSRKYCDNQGVTEDIGIPEPWCTGNGEQEQLGLQNSGFRSQKPDPNIVYTTIGEFPKDANTAAWLFWKIMGFRAWRYDEIKRQFALQYDLHWSAFNELRALIPNYLAKDDEDRLWHYQGPVFDEE